MSGDRVGLLASTKRFASEAAGSRGEPKRELSEAEQRAAAKQRRRERYTVRRITGREILPKGNAIGKCGMRARPDGQGNRAEVQIREADQTSYYAGLLNCGSVWMCARCAPVILSQRADEINEIARVAQEQGATVLFVLLTCRHHAWSDPTQTVKLVSGAWGKILSGREWAGHTGKERAKRLDADLPVSDGLKGELGYIGMSRAMELTHADPEVVRQWLTERKARRKAGLKIDDLPVDNGYHPHTHSALVFEGQLTPQQVFDLQGWIFARWNKYLVKQGAEEVLPGLGCNIERWQSSGGEENKLGHYCTKVAQGWSLGAELTAAEHKLRGNSNPAQLVAKYCHVRERHRLATAKGEVLDLAEVEDQEKRKRIICEIYRATKGKKLTYTSPKLRAWAIQHGAKLTKEEAKDEDLANVEVNGGTVVGIDEDCWTAVRRQHAEGDLLDVSEEAPAGRKPQALRDYLLLLGIVTVLSPSADDGGHPVLMLDQRHYPRGFLLRRAGRSTKRRTGTAAAPSG